MPNERSLVNVIVVPDEKAIEIARELGRILGKKI